MSDRITNDTSDPVVAEVEQLLVRYKIDHPVAEIRVYRQNRVSVRVRVIDPAFSPLSRSERSKMVWPLLRQLPEDALSEISMVLLLAPEEANTSMVNREFDDPIPSRF